MSRQPSVCQVGMIRRTGEMLGLLEKRAAARWEGGEGRGGLRPSRAQREKLHRRCQSLA